MSKQIHKSDKQDRSKVIVPGFSPLNQYVFETTGGTKVSIKAYSKKDALNRLNKSGFEFKISTLHKQK